MASKKKGLTENISHISPLESLDDGDANADKN